MSDDEFARRDIETSEGAIRLVGIYVDGGERYECLEADHITRDAFAPRPSNTCPGWSYNINGHLLRCAERKSIGTFIDVGGHIGMTSIPFARANKGRVPHYIFEPSPLNRFLLERNLALNGITDAKVVPIAVSDRPAKLKMAASGYNTHDHRIRNPATPLVDGGMYDTAARVTYDVGATSLDAHFAGIDLPRPIVLKIDVQGHELSVLRGARELRPEVVIFEYWPYGLIQAGTDRDAFMGELARWTRGAILIEVGMTQTTGGHLSVAEMVPWDGVQTTAIDIIMSREGEGLS